jgi:hypothetical protein
MPNGILQGNWGDVLNDVRGGSLDQLQQAVERLVIGLTTPLSCSQQIQINWTGAAGPAVQVTASANATPQAIGVQINQGGPNAILGVGQQSIGILANALANRDLYQPQTNSIISQFMAVMTKLPFGKTVTGFLTTGSSTGRPSNDTGSMTAGPGETMPNATVSAYKKVVTNNFEFEGLLTSSLAAATNGLTGASTATLQTWVVDSANEGNLKNGEIVTVTNRDTTFSLASGKYVQAKYVNSEIRISWAAC